MPATASVVGSSRVTTVGSDGAPATVTIPGAPATRPSNSVYGDSTSPANSSGLMWVSRSRPSRRATATIEPSGVKAYDERPKIQAGSANSAAIGASASSDGPSSRR